MVRFRKGGAPEETLGKSSEKSSEKILRHLRQESTLSARTLAERLSLSPRAIEKQIDLLKKDGRLIRIGPTKGGHWQASTHHSSPQPPYYLRKQLAKP